MAAPDAVLKLIELFDRNRDAYLSGAYKEAQLRHEFIDPFFKALGWDVYNESGYAEAYKDVIYEDAIKVGGFTKAPDYCFRTGGTRKFFVEAKKPSVDIKDEPSPAFQLRRYAWSAKLPLSLLTDFEEFAVYDCRVKPVKIDKAGTARILYMTDKDYADQWDQITSVFSREAVLQGSFDKYAEETRGKKGTAEVDDAFLKEIESWRDLIARNIALRNPALTQRELNFAVQQTIDRIIFLRICEDRGIEEYGHLMALLNGDHVYGRLFELFQRADERYNSGLFHFRKEKGRNEPADELTPLLAVDDKPLKEIVKNLYYPDSAYEFSVLPADILGQVYEQFLGKVIRLTPGHRAVVEDKPEVKKAGGVYYTPTYIVDYIVKNTVGKLLEDKTPKQAAKLRILDPACGSGSFLIGAYQYLLDWHRDWYAADGLRKHTKELYQGSGGDWRLTTAERKRILLNNIYGVDIDPQAVEVTKLSLLLKVLEGESDETLSKQLQLFHERALPDLSDNIKCGNSLIGPDFYHDKQMSLMDDEERYRINAFDWDAEFPEIMKGGGFDAVIGNPPYGVPFYSEESVYLSVRYPNTQKYPDSYCMFITKGYELSRIGGFLSLIVPNTFCDLESCDDFRLWFLGKSSLQNIWQSGWAFKSAIVDTIVFIIRNDEPLEEICSEIKVEDRVYERKQLSFRLNELHKIDYRNTEDDKLLLDRVLDRSTPLEDLAVVKAGVKLYEKGKGDPPQTERTLEERPYTIMGHKPRGWRSLYRGKHVDRYFFSEVDEFVNYGPWLAAPRMPELFTSPKILMRRTDDRIKACIEKESSIAVNSCHVIKLKSEEEYFYYYLLGIINSKLLQRIFELQNPQMVGKIFAEIKVIYVERLPVYVSDLRNDKHNNLRDTMVGLVKTMLALCQQVRKSQTPGEKLAIKRQIEATDCQIDQLVYKLYGLTEEEIRIVEDALSLTKYKRGVAGRVNKY